MFRLFVSISATTGTVVEPTLGAVITFKAVALHYDWLNVIRYTL